MDNQYPYEVFAPDGTPILETPESCRYDKKTELSLLNAGYTIKLQGKKITKKEVKGNAC